MKKSIGFICLLTLSLTSFGQKLSMNKTETIAFLAKQFKLAEGRHDVKPNDNYSIKNCDLTFNRGVLTINYSEYEDNKLYAKQSISFSPLDMIDVGVVNSGTKNVGILKEVFLYLNEYRSIQKSKSFEKPFKEDQRDISQKYLKYSYNDIAHYDDFSKGLLHLKQLLQAETDPFELNTDEKRLAALFAKYKTCITGKKPQGSFKGSKVIAENLKLSLSGPCASYSSETTVSGLEDNTSRKTKGYIDFRWDRINSIKYNAEQGTLIIKSEELPFYYETFTPEQVDKFKSKGISFVFYFKTKDNDTNGEARKDIMEVIDLIKKTIKVYGGKDVNVDLTAS